MDYTSFLKLTFLLYLSELAIIIPWAIKIVCDSLHGVLCMRLCLVHVSCNSSTKLPMYGAESALNPVSNLTDGCIDTLLSFCNLPTFCTLVYHPAYELHSNKHLPILCWIIAFVGIARGATGRSAFFRGVSICLMSLSLVAVVSSAKIRPFSSVTVCRL